MKSILLSFGSKLLRSALTSSELRSGIISTLAGFGAGLNSRRNPDPEPVHTINPDFQYLNQSAKSYVATTLWGVLSAAVFVLSLFTTVVLIAGSFDAYGQLVPTITMNTTALLMILSGIGLLVAMRKFRALSFSWEQFLRGATSFPVVAGFTNANREVKAPEASATNVEEDLPMQEAEDKVTPHDSRERIAS